MLRLIGGLVRRLYFTPKAQYARWPALQEEVMQAKRAFDAAWDGLTEAEALRAVRKAELASVADVLAHLTFAHRLVAHRLTEIAAGASREDAPLPEGLWAGAGARSWAEVREEYDAAWRAVEQAIAADGLAGSRAVQGHFFFGPMTAREWVVLLAIHFGYHTRQVRRFRRRLGQAR